MINVTDIVYSGNGFTATFDDNSVGEASYEVINGSLELVGLSNEQKAALLAFTLKIPNNTKQYDPRFNQNSNSSSQFNGGVTTPSGVLSTFGQVKVLDYIQAPSGSSAALGVSIGTTPSAATRTGFYNSGASLVSFASGTQVLEVGQTIFNGGYDNTVVGNNNNVTGFANAVDGNYNSVSGSSNGVVGTQNMVSSYSSTVGNSTYQANFNVVQGKYHNCIGSYNVLSGIACSAPYGVNNTVQSGRYAYALAGAYSGIVFGHYASISAVQAMAFGYNVSASADRSIAFGPTSATRVADTLNTKAIIVKRDGSESNQFGEFAGAQVVVATNEINLLTTGSSDAITLPDGARWWFDEVGMIITSVTGAITGQLTFSIGVTGNDTKYLSGQATAGLAAVYDRDKFSSLAADDGETDTNIRVTVGTAITGPSVCRGRFYFKGVLIEEE